MNAGQLSNGIKISVACYLFGITGAMLACLSHSVVGLPGVLLSGSVVGVLGAIVTGSVFLAAGERFWSLRYCLCVLTFFGGAVFEEYLIRDSMRSDHFKNVGQKV